jgi:SAM-dependent methyltransferase
MIRYLGIASLLKLFSVNPQLKMIYRRFGNLIEQDEKNLFDTYLPRSELLLDLCRRYNVVKTGDSILELGTGWYHWYSLYLRLHYDVKITMFDVWDNRRFNSMKTLISQIQPSNPIISGILRVQSFDELYESLNLKYVIDKGGSLSRFPSEKFNCIFSFHTLEHVHRSEIHKEISEFNRVLNPGGFSIHQIGLDDHLSHYDNKESAKKYLEFPDKTWKRLFENDVQYFNRMQASDWLTLFKNSGFTLIEQKPIMYSLKGMKVSREFQHYSKEDIACAGLTVVHKKN